MDFSSGPVIDNHLPVEGIHLQCGRPGFHPWVEKGKATPSSILAWRIPWTVQSMGLQRVGHGSVTFTFTASGGSTGSIPGLGRAHLIQRNKAHASQLLNPRAATIEA